MLKEIKNDFQWVGKALFEEGLNSSHSGNISIRDGRRILITRKGAMLGRLKEGDLVEVKLKGEVGDEQLASSELPAHRAIYLKTSAKAIVHCHPPHAIAISLLMNRMIPVDVEGAYHLKEVPVLVSKQPVGSSELAAEIAALLEYNKVILCRGHGSFAVGSRLEEAYQWSSCLEHSSKILWLSRAFVSSPLADDIEP
jgi:L-fuculose-phosphate aldolase